MNTEHMGLFMKYQNFELRGLVCVYVSLHNSYTTIHSFKVYNSMVFSVVPAVRLLPQSILEHFQKASLVLRKRLRPN